MQKNANPTARISVKLVSEVAGTVAAGVAKAYAEHILIQVPTVEPGLAADIHQTRRLAVGTWFS